MPEPAPLAPEVLIEVLCGGSHTKLLCEAPRLDEAMTEVMWSFAQSPPPWLEAVKGVGLPIPFSLPERPPETPFLAHVAKPT